VHQGDLEARIQKLIGLGYPREDIHVLPDGGLTIVPSDDLRSSAIAIARATAPARIERMSARKNEIDEQFQKAESVAPEMHEEYSRLIDELERAKALLP
jgi:hypothetical protein